MARIVCDNNRNLGANADLLINELGLSIHYSEMLKRYTKYAHEFRHAVGEGKEGGLPATQEVERSFIPPVSLLGWQSSN